MSLTQHDTLQNCTFTFNFRYIQSDTIRQYTAGRYTCREQAVGGLVANGLFPSGKSWLTGSYKKDGKTRRLIKPKMSIGFYIGLNNHHPFNNTECEDMDYIFYLIVGTWLHWLFPDFKSKIVLKNTPIIPDTKLVSLEDCIKLWGYDPYEHLREVSKQTSYPSNFNVTFDTSSLLAGHKLLLHLTLGLMRDALDISVNFRNDLKAFEKISTTAEIKKLIKDKETDKIAEILLNVFDTLNKTGSTLFSRRPVNNNTIVTLKKIIESGLGVEAFNVKSSRVLSENWIHIRGYWENAHSNILGYL